MKMRRLFSMILGLVVLAKLGTVANAQMTEHAAREQARSAVRSQLHLTPDKFLGVQRDEDLEQSLAEAVGRLAGSEFIYKVSPTGYELRENSIINHILIDGDLIYVIAVSPKDGSIHRIHGFADALAEFNNLMRAVGETVSSPEQAESLADFYRDVNPENLPLTPISSLLDLKQAAERQCQSGLSSFNTGQEAFTTWWKHAKPLYAELSFKQTAVPRSGGYFVEWIVLSSAAPHGSCGGAPLRARLEVSADGHVGKVTFSPLRKGGLAQSRTN
jgi:hypothetical protein